MEELAQLQGIIEQTYERRRIHRIIEFLQKNGFEAKSSVGIPLKPIAVQCGLGWQGKNTSLN
jgi:epoxyqueuosine reductase QueG